MIAYLKSPFVLQIVPLVLQGDRGIVQPSRLTITNEL